MDSIWIKGGSKLNGEIPISGAKNWSSGYMPATYQGTILRSAGEPILDLRPPEGMSDATQRRLLDTLSEFNGEHFCHRHFTRFRHRVGCRSRVAEDTCAIYRRRNDDAAALFLQVWHRVLDRQECSGQIVREGACPILQRELLNRRPDAVDARIGEDDIHPAPAINNLLDGALHLVLLCNISDNGHALVAIALNLVRCLLYLTGGMTERSDACTLLCK